MGKNKISIGYKRCVQQHILGQIREGASGRAVLALYSEAIDYGQDMPETVDVIAMIESAKAIRCSICGSVTDWHIARSST